MAVQGAPNLGVNMFRRKVYAGRGLWSTIRKGSKALYNAGSRIVKRDILPAAEVAAKAALTPLVGEKAAEAVVNITKEAGGDILAGKNVVGSVEGAVKKEANRQVNNTIAATKKEQIGGRLNGVLKRAMKNAQTGKGDIVETTPKPM